MKIVNALENTLMEQDIGRPRIALAGGTGDLGKRIARELIVRGAIVRALVRKATPETHIDALKALGADVIRVDFAEADSLRDACMGSDCVVSTLNGLRPTIIDTQTRLLRAAIAAGVPRFIPSDFCLDFTATKPGNNRNLDLRQEFKSEIDRVTIRTTSILNGAFTDLLIGQAPIVLTKVKKILFWGRPNQELDFTSKDDVAWFTAAAALDNSTPRFLRIAGDVVTAESLAQSMTSLRAGNFRPQRAGSIALLGILIKIIKMLTPQNQSVFPAWQGMQYLRDMFSGDGKLRDLDNDRYGHRSWKTARDVLKLAASS